MRAFRSLLMLALGLAASACSDGSSATQGPRGGGRVITLTGAGASFPYPIYARWFAAYGRAHGVRVNYQSLGSGAGIRQITQGLVDFGATDAPMGPDELARVPGLLHLPTVLGAVAVVYNLRELKTPIRLDGSTVADLFAGRIRRWNDPRLAALNPGVRLPAVEVLPIFRTDASGTTWVFTDYLSVTSPRWARSIGHGKTVRFPRGLGARGNAGVTGQVQALPGSIGYVEEAYAQQHTLQMAALRNGRGQFLPPTTSSVEAAAAGAFEARDLRDRRVHPHDLRISLVNAPGDAAYPVVGWSYLLVPQHLPDCRRARALAEVIRWSLTYGDAEARALHYAPLPQAAQAHTLALLSTVTCGAGPEPRGSRS